VDLGPLLIDQLTFYWDTHLWPRLGGLTDEEYLWEPVPGCWSLRPARHGGFRLEGRRPEPSPPPVTTIAWRMMHVAVGCFHIRHAAFFDPSAPPDADMFDRRLRPSSLPGTAKEGLAFFAESYQRWHDAIAALDEDGLARPLGPRGSYFSQDPMAALIVHVNREVMHHGGEIGLLRDLYARGGSPA
jgi:hypothetical protein